MITNKETLDLLKTFNITNGNVRTLTMTGIKRDIQYTPTHFSTTYKIQDPADVKAFKTRISNMLCMLFDEFAEEIEKQSAKSKENAYIENAIVVHDYTFSLEIKSWIIIIYIN